MSTIFNKNTYYEGLNIGFISLCFYYLLTMLFINSLLSLPQGEYLMCFIFEEITKSIIGSIVFVFIVKLIFEFTSDFVLIGNKLVYNLIQSSKY